MRYKLQVAGYKGKSEIRSAKSWKFGCAFILWIAQVMRQTIINEENLQYFIAADGFDARDYNMFILN